APRVAYFPDSFLEINGVAMTSRRLVNYAKDRGYPFLCIHAGKKTEEYADGSISYVCLNRSPVAFAMDEDLAYDPLFQRHTNRVLRKLVEFRPDAMHITGLNDVSIIGAYLAWKLQLPLLGSWHTNIHEFAARRLTRIFRFMSDSAVSKMTGFVERKIMDGAMLYYKMPKVVLAPNQELVDRLERDTGRVAKLMVRGVDAEKFSPERRTLNDGIFRLGFVGRLRAEKNVRLLIDLEKELIKAGKTNFRLLIVGEGNEREYLEKHLINADFTGFLAGDELSEAYANMDVFVFPSETDAFGNVAQEAHASGVAAIVTDQGGPKFIIRHNETGFIAKNLADFVKFTLELMDNPEKLARMKIAARNVTLSRSWDAVFDGVYEAYEDVIRLAAERKAGAAAA
ncbi:MAG: glycosyltransferase, partial [Acidobacteria bacterium]|nr:glycosyltransferase [Acidobacteriota bacterium]MCA1608912.1 glycosyltransferase [Acidobacteriota bacterium]